MPRRSLRRGLGLALCGQTGFLHWSVPCRSLSGAKPAPQDARKANGLSPRRDLTQRCNWGHGGYIPREFRAKLEPRSSGQRAGRNRKGYLMFISPAFAQGIGGADGNMLMSLLPFILIFVIMYFLILRPQQKRAKQHQEMVKNLRRGDTVITSGGLIGKVTKVVDDEQVEVEIADGVRVRQLRQMMTDVRAKGEPVKDEAVS
jgi:preprotein translocase subunit YajC